MIIQFFEPMIPPTVTHQEKEITIRHGKPVVYEPPALKDARAKLRAYIGKHRPEQPLTGAIEIFVEWRFPVAGDHKDHEPKLTKPDTDNLQKLLKDVMTDLGFWKDDAQVFREHVCKIYADTPGIGIYVTNEHDERVWV